jgi:hypothetical protein
VATEGFGNLPVSPYTFGILGTLDGREVSIRGSIPSPFPAAGGLPEEPPVILTTAPQAATLSPPTDGPKVEDVGVGSRVRITRGQLLGASGIIDSVPSKPQTIQSGLAAPGAYVKIDDTLHYIPWANLEQINC